jgi:hypothetical protein
MAAGDVITIVEDNLGKKGNYFDGTDDYVLIDAHAVERVAANDTTGTYTAWIYLDNASSTFTILSAGDNDSANEFLNFRYGSDGKLYFQLKQGGAFQFRVFCDGVVARKWAHVAVVQNGVQPVIYVNGVLGSNPSNLTATDLTMWYDELANCDKFAIGILESNATHTEDFQGAIGTVKYWNRALSAAEIYKDFNGESVSTGELPDSTYLRLNVTMEDDGTTDSGAGADNGTLTGNAHYGGLISSHSRRLEANCSGHAAERSTTFQVSPTKLCSVIVRGD